MFEFLNLPPNEQPNLVPRANLYQMPGEPGRRAGILSWDERKDLYPQDFDTRTGKAQLTPRQEKEYELWLRLNGRPISEISWDGLGNVSRTDPVHVQEVEVANTQYYLVV